MVLVTDALCYSATDIFAAGFQDHRIGPVLGADDNTGAGGANVWTHALLLQLLGQNGDAADPLPGSPLRALAEKRRHARRVRRTLRVGRQAGTEVEDLGVVPDERHKNTRRDVMEGNADLIEKAARCSPRATASGSTHAARAGAT